MAFSVSSSINLLRIGTSASKVPSRVSYSVVQRSAVIEMEKYSAGLVSAPQAT